MNKQEQAKSTLLGKVGGNTIMEDRYYVQRITDQVFMVRERMAADGEAGPDDRIVRSFDFRHDAYVFAGSLNDKQKKLDEQYGQWAQNAI